MIKLLLPLAAITLVSLFPQFLSAQDLDKKEQEKYDKAMKLANDTKKDNSEQVIGMLKEITAASPKVADPWESLADLQFRKYQVSYELGNLSSDSLRKLNEILAPQKKKSRKKGEEDENVAINIDTIRANIKKAMNQEKQDLVLTCRQATLYSDKTYRSSFYLRYVMVDKDVDSARSKEAKDNFLEGESNYRNSNFPEAIRYYEKALAIDSNYYGARLYMGDAYLKMNEYPKALMFYTETEQKYPGMLEPRRYIVDALIQSKDFTNALKPCLDALLTYPDGNVFDFLTEIATQTNKTFNRHWVSRNFEINRIGVDQSALTDRDWKFYREAKAKIAPYCDENGLITKPNDLTKQKYLESYCWEYMLNKSENPDFGFARKMALKGYLDCYVLISLYHYDVYAQYKDLVTSDSKRARKYLMQLME